MTSRASSPRWPILIAGAGIPALACAIAMASAAGDAISVTVMAPGHDDRADPRAYALSPSSRRMLERLDVWSKLGPVQPIRAMSITDGRTEDAVRSEYLRFDAASASSPLATMVAGSELATALRARAEELGIVFERNAVGRFELNGRGLAVTLADGSTREVALLVAADGVRSRLRDWAGIPWTGHAYRQTGLVATISHERPHDGVAIQHFLPGGPFAILPLAGAGQHFPHRSSIVWSEADDVATAVLGLAEAERAAALDARVGRHHGAVAFDSPLASFPLSVGLARRIAGDRLALLGDAAHVVHPLAGQGLNLSLGDAASLAEAMVDSVRLGLDPGRREVLDGYDRERRLPAAALAGVTDGLNRLFSNDATAIRALRDLGLGLVDRFGPAKAMFRDAAAGRLGREPRLMRDDPA